MFIILQIFLLKAAFGRPFIKTFKRQIYSVGAQNIVSLLKMFSSIHFSNLSGMKSKRTNANRKVQKLENITWGISSDIPQFWLHHVTCLGHSRAKNIWWIIKANRCSYC